MKSFTIKCKNLQNYLRFFSSFFGRQYRIENELPVGEFKDRTRSFLKSRYAEGYVIGKSGLDEAEGLNRISTDFQQHKTEIEGVFDKEKSMLQCKIDNLELLLKMQDEGNFLENYLKTDKEVTDRIIEVRKKFTDLENQILDFEESEEELTTQLNIVKTRFFDGKTPELGLFQQGKIYYPTLAAFFMVEMPLNAQAFSGITDGYYFVSLGLGVATSFLLGLTGHSFGENIASKDWGKAKIHGLVFFLITFTICIMRWDSKAPIVLSLVAVLILVTAVLFVMNYSPAVRYTSIKHRLTKTTKRLNGLKIEQTEIQQKAGAYVERAKSKASVLFKQGLRIIQDEITNLESIKLLQDKSKEMLFAKLVNTQNEAIEVFKSGIIAGRRKAEQHERKSNIDSLLGFSKMFSLIFIMFIFGCNPTRDQDRTILTIVDISYKQNVSATDIQSKIWEEFNLEKDQVPLIGLDLFVGSISDVSIQEIHHDRLKRERSLLTTNLLQRKADFSRLKHELDSTLKKILLASQETKPKSRVIEGINYAVNQIRRKNHDSLTVLLFSDLMQLDERSDFYKKGDITQLAELNMKGVKKVIVYYQPDPSMDVLAAKTRQLWTAAFQKSGVKDIDFQVP